MTTTDKLNHIKDRLREQVNLAEVYDKPVFIKLAAENWIETIEDLEDDMKFGSNLICAKAHDKTKKTIARWEAVYGEIKGETK